MDEFERILDDPAGGLAHADPVVRRLALSMLAGSTEHFELVVRALSDAEPRVRAEAAETLGTMEHAALEPLLFRAAVEDTEIAVEAIAAALGELENRAAVPWLMDVAAGHHDTLTRETAVAALGAIGDDSALTLLLELVGAAPPQVRRRAVVALTVFDGPEVEAAIRAAVDDRNPMVREAAEMVVGRPVDGWVGVELRREPATTEDGPPV